MEQPDYCNMDCREMLVRLCQSHEDMKRRLLGNGQPGEVDKLRARVGALEDFRAEVKALPDRVDGLTAEVDALKGFRQWVNGALFVFGAVHAVMIAAVGWLFTRGK